MHAVTIRHANVSDAARIGAIHVGSWQWAYRGLIPDEYLDGLDPLARGETWLGRLQNDEVCRRVFVAEIDGAPVGFASIGASRDEDAEPATGEVMAIYLDPARVSIGVGRVLFAAALAALREAGHDRATVWVLDGNVRARRFYESAGMQPDGATKHDDSRGFMIREVRYRISL